MKVIIAGSRDIQDYDLLCQEVDRWIKAHGPITEVVSGTARGVDQLGELWAFDNGVPVRRFPAKWNLYGNSAGWQRNVQMAEYVSPCGGCIIIRYSDSRGSKMMSEIATVNSLILQEKVVERGYQEASASGHTQGVTHPEASPGGQAEGTVIRVVLPGEGDTPDYWI